MQSKAITLQDLIFQFQAQIGLAFGTLCILGLLNLGWKSSEIWIEHFRPNSPKLFDSGFQAILLTNWPEMGLKWGLQGDSLPKLDLAWFTNKLAWNGLKLDLKSKQGNSLAKHWNFLAKHRIFIKWNALKCLIWCLNLLNRVHPPKCCCKMGSDPRGIEPLKAGHEHNAIPF